MRQNWLEWVALVISVVAVIGVVGFLLVDGLRDEGEPPNPTVELHIDQAYPTDHGWIVPATVTNGGDEAAEALVLRATASVAGEEEESELTVDYLPAGTAVEISFGFTAEPEETPAVQVVGFRLP
jgi:uncharacterized protein (TIGR02588 family)